MSLQLGEISSLRKALQQSDVERGVKQFQAVRDVIVSMTNGVDVSSLFPEMLKVFFEIVLRS
jgi:vesicle coat complex subunit